MLVRRTSPARAAGRGAQSPRDARGFHRQGGDRLSAAERDATGDQQGSWGRVEAGLGAGLVAEGREAAWVTAWSSPGSPPCRPHAAHASRNLQAGRPHRAEPQAPSVTPNGHLRPLLSCTVSMGRGRRVSGVLSGQCRKDRQFRGVGHPDRLQFNAVEEGPGRVPGRTTCVNLAGSLGLFLRQSLTTGEIISSS